jgi:hypothetical protein
MTKSKIPNQHGAVLVIGCWGLGFVWILDLGTWSLSRDSSLQRDLLLDPQQPLRDPIPVLRAF